jgi:hypothetical protein
MAKKTFNLNELKNSVKFTKMNDKDKINVIKTYRVIHNNYCYKWDGRKKKIIRTLERSL